MVAATVSTMFSTMAVGAISSVTAIALLVLAYPPAGAVAVIALVVLVSAMIMASRRRRALAMRMVREQVDVATVAVTSLSQIEVIKASGAEDHASSRWTTAHNRFLAAMQQLGERTVALDVLPSFLLTVANAGVTVVGLMGVTQGRLSLGGFVAVQTLLGLALAPAAMVVGQFQRAETLRATGPDRRCAAHGGTDHRGGGGTFGGSRRSRRGPSVDGNHVRLRPEPATAAGRLRLHITPGSRVALVGPSGCGKSTVARLVVGLYDPWEGEILIDGRPAPGGPSRCSAGRFRWWIRIPSSSPARSGTTSRCGIRRSATPPSFRRPKMRPCDEIARRPGSYEAELREGGGDLSGVNGNAWRLPGARA